VKKISQFFREVGDQLRQVTWPDKETLFRLTGVVILISVTMGLLLGGLDFLLTRGMGYIIE